MCEYFAREETSKIERAIYWRENFRKSEHFCEHQKFGEDFWREQFNILVFKKRVKRQFSRFKKARKKKTYDPQKIRFFWINIYLHFIIKNMQQKSSLR